MSSEIRPAQKRRKHRKIRSEVEVATSKLKAAKLLHAWNPKAFEVLAKHLPAPPRGDALGAFGVNILGSEGLRGTP